MIKMQELLKEYTSANFIAKMKYKIIDNHLSKIHELSYRISNYF